MYGEQIRNNWPGLAKEVEEIYVELPIENVNVTYIGKKSYLKWLAKACRIKEEAIMKQKSENMTKMQKITWEARSYMLRVAGNYSHHQRYASTGWRCQGCSLMVREDQDHLSFCDGYADLKLGKDLEEESDLVDFYRLVMARREQEGWD